MNREELYIKWQELYKKAQENMHLKKGNKGVLIEVAAQHPLINGEKPNEEFEKRLLLAMQIFKTEKSKGKKVYLYVPGSLHMDNGVVDSISLSEAGKRFLMQHNVLEENIFADEMNYKYKGENGVYNSTDECYVASRIFEDMNFAELHSVCSSGQMMRKVLSYIRFGCVPYMHTVSCDEMYHNYIDEIFKYIPILLEDENALQGKSNEAERLRKLRKPE